MVRIRNGVRQVAGVLRERVLWNASGACEKLDFEEHNWDGMIMHRQSVSDPETLEVQEYRAKLSFIDQGNLLQEIRSESQPIVASVRLGPDCHPVELQMGEPTISA